LGSKLIYPGRNDALLGFDSQRLEFLTGFIPKDSRIQILKVESWGQKVEIGLDRFAFSYHCWNVLTRRLISGDLTTRLFLISDAESIPQTFPLQRWDSLSQILPSPWKTAGGVEYFPSS